jgi:hypothetical protein
MASIDKFETKNPLFSFDPYYIIHKSFPSAEVINGNEIKVHHKTDNNLNYIIDYYATFKRVKMGILASNNNMSNNDCYGWQFSRGFIYKKPYLSFHVNDYLSFHMTLTDAYEIIEIIIIYKKYGNDKTIITFNLVRCNVKCGMGCSSVKCGMGCNHNDNKNQLDQVILEQPTQPIQPAQTPTLQTKDTDYKNDHTHSFATLSTSSITHKNVVSEKIYYKRYHNNKLIVSGNTTNNIITNVSYIDTNRMELIDIFEYPSLNPLDYKFPLKTMGYYEKLL